MIRDKIIELDNGKSYYILEDISYNNKKYFLTVECDLSKDDIKEKDYLVMEVEVINDNLNIKNVKEQKTAIIITKMLLEKLNNNK